MGGRFVKRLIPRRVKQAWRAAVQREIARARPPVADEAADPAVRKALEASLQHSVDTAVHQADVRLSEVHRTLAGETAELRVLVTDLVAHEATVRASAVDHAVSAERVLASPYIAGAAVVSDPEDLDLAFPSFAPMATSGGNGAGDAGDGDNGDGDAGADGELPLPPTERWTVIESFLEDGKRDADRMVEAVAAAGLELSEGTRVLDFGCGPGRVLRWLPRHIDGWGIDVDADRIAWCQSALSPPFRFAACGTYPHLPFPDERFDLVYAGSVFTHLSELADAWLLELLRVTAPGGILYLTVHDQSSIAFCREKDPTSWSRALSGFSWSDDTEARFREWAGRLGDDLDGFTIGRGYLAQVFYDRDAIVAHWGRYAEVVDVMPDAFAYHQTAIVLRRQPDTV